MGSGVLFVVGRAWIAGVYTSFDGFIMVFIFSLMLFESRGLLDVLVSMSSGSVALMAEVRIYWLNRNIWRCGAAFDRSLKFSNKKFGRTIIVQTSGTCS